VGLTCVTWGNCAGRDDVRRFIDAATSADTQLSDVSVDVLDDRLVVSLRVGADVHHQAVFLTGGAITEICDAADPDHASRLRPVGPLATAAARATNVTAAAPILPVRDLDTAVHHYGALGFEVHRYEGDAAYAYAERDGLSLHLAQVADLDSAQNTCAVYLYVTDADALYAQWRASGPAGRLVAPVDAEYGLREGAHVDPDGNLLRFGSPLP
jgi:catechol 2,3-dioxygenase-like lactoylglutathione lyase family enzyme